MLGRVFFLLALLVVMCAPPVYAQSATPEPTPTPPALEETYEGRGRMDDITFAYPEGWHTLDGIPVNRLVSFNVVSSVRIGLRSRIEPGEEALVMAFGAGRIDRWPTIDADATPEEILEAFFERVGDDSQFSGEEQDGEFEQVTESFTLNGNYEAVLVRFEEVETTATDEASKAAEDAEEDFDGEFIAYSIRLDDNRFLVVLVLTSELSYDDAQPTLDAILGSLAYTP